MPRLQYMPINDFDRGLVDKFEAQDFEYNPANWDRLTQRLPESRNSRVKRYIWLPLTGIAAAVALLIGVPMMMQRGDDNPVAGNKTQVKTEVVQTTSANGISTPQARTVITVASDNSNQQANNSQPQPYTASLPANNSGNNSSNQRVINSSLNPTIVNQSQTILDQPIAVTEDPVSSTIMERPAPGQTLPVPENPMVPVSNQQTIASKPNLQIATPNEQTITQTNPQSNASIMMETMRKIDNGMSLGIDPDAIGVAKNKKTSLSLTGGYNQGTTNMGYALGVNTRRNIGERLYIEGDVAFSSNRNTMQTTAMNTAVFDMYMEQTPQNLTNAGKAAGAETANEMLYLQVTPVVGYQVGKNWSVGAGPDMQRMFQNGETTFYIVDEAKVKPVPVMDYGLVGKTEYRLYKSFKAGVQYRYGMNSVLTPEKNYLNRSYLQVQLKVGILGSKK